MKKIISLAALLLLALSVSAQSILGKWKTTVVEDGEKIPMVITFKDKGVMTISSQTKQSEPEVGTIHISLKVNGTYKQDGNKLFVTLDPKKSRVEVSRIDFNTSMKAMLLVQPEMEQQVIEMMNSELRKHSGELVKEMPLAGDITIKELTDKKLVLTGEEDVVLTR